jgi:beta-catenin-like protein 1
MTSVDELFKKPNLPIQTSSKRKFEAPDAEQVYKAAKLSTNGSPNGRHLNGVTVENAADDDDDDIEAGPELPPDDGGDDEEGRFFGGGKKVAKCKHSTKSRCAHLSDSDHGVMVAEVY